MMFQTHIESESHVPALEAHLLGCVDFEACLTLQRRLVDEATARDDARITLLLCEHNPVVTIGRGGRPGQIASENHMLRSGRIKRLWVARGGGCFVHCPGQLAVYPIVPLRWHDYSVGEFVERLQVAIIETLCDLNISARSSQDKSDICGRTGRLSMIGISVRDWVTYFGAYVNVCPSTGLFRLLRPDSIDSPADSSLETERQGRIRMQQVRATLISRLTETLGLDRFHLHTGHPYFRGESRTRRLLDDCAEARARH